MLFTPLLKSLDVPTEVGLLRVHMSNFGRMPFMLPPLTHMGTSESWTQAHWVPIRRLNHCSMAALTFTKRWNLQFRQFIFSPSSWRIPWLHCTLAAAQCIVIGHVCGCVTVLFVCLWVCYHENSKLRASILAKLGLSIKVLTISSWLNFGHPTPPGRGSAVGRNFFGSALLQPARSVCVSLNVFHWPMFWTSRLLLVICFWLCD